MADVKPALTHRQRQALETRKIILDAGRELFLERGYAAATIEAIAQRAGVAVSTVYAAYTNKRGILRAIREAWHQSSDVRDIYRRALATDDAARRIELFAHATRRQWETGAATLRIYTGAAAADPEAAAELQEALNGRRRNVGAWLEQSAPSFRPDLGVEQIRAIHLALTLPEVYRELVEVAGWTPDAYEAWLAQALKQQLLP